MTLVTGCNLSAWCSGDEVDLRPALENVKTTLETLVLSTGHPPDRLMRGQGWLGAQH